MAFAVLHFSVALVPLATVLGLAAKATVGVGDLTEIVADCVALWLWPVQVNV